MTKAIFKLPPIKTNPKNYAPGSAERKELKEKIADLRKGGLDLPMIIDGKEVRTGNLQTYVLHTINNTWGTIIKVAKSMCKWLLMPH